MSGTTAFLLSVPHEADSSLLLPASVHVRFAAALEAWRHAPAGSQVHLSMVDELDLPERGLLAHGVLVVGPYVGALGPTSGALPSGRVEQWPAHLVQEVRRLLERYPGMPVPDPHPPLGQVLSSADPAPSQLFLLARTLRTPHGEVLEPLSLHAGTVPAVAMAARWVHHVERGLPVSARPGELVVLPVLDGQPIGDEAAAVWTQSQAEQPDWDDLARAHDLLVALRDGVVPS